jgi:hypothetical protein
MMDSYEFCGSEADKEEKYRKMAEEWNARIGTI